MSEQNLGARPRQNPDAAHPDAAQKVDAAVVIEPRDLESTRQALTRADAGGALAEFERNQLARDIADIESATAVLRRVEPALQSWTKPQASVVPKSRPVWLMIGLLWLSTAIVTAGAAYAIAVLYG